MHIPDAYLSPATQAVAIVVMTPIWVVAARKTRATLSARQVPLLSMGAAFAFAIQMFNIPAVGGTTAHALGTAMLAILLGPWAAIVAMTLCLTVQAFFFGDGGILSLGANCWDMAVVSAFVTYGVYRVLTLRSEQHRVRSLVAAATASYLGTAFASFSAGLILGAQPVVAHDALGRALYFPFGWNVAVPSMVNIHLLVAAPAEAIITAVALAYLWRNFPELISGQAKQVRVQSSLRLAKVLAAVLIVTPLGLIASGDAWGEWDTSALAKLVGYVPAGTAHQRELLRPLMPDYSFAGHEGTSWAVIGYIVSALLGSALIIGTIKAIARPSRNISEPQVGSGPELSLPAFLSLPNPVALQRPRAGKPWLEKTLLQMRESIATATFARENAERKGFLQQVPAFYKLLGTVGLLITVSFIRSGTSLFVILLAVWVLAGASKLSLRTFSAKVAGAAGFFGLILALPLCLSSVSHGPVLFTLLGIEISARGGEQALFILLRLGAGIATTLLFTSTTPHLQLAAALRRMKLPTLFVTGLLLTYRYLFVFLDTLSEMIVARKSRQAGCITKQQARLYTGAASAVLFAKSMVFSEESYNAMRSRLFDFDPGVRKEGRLRMLRWVWASCLLSALLIALAGGLHAL